MSADMGGMLTGMDAFIQNFEQALGMARGTWFARIKDGSDLSDPVLAVQGFAMVPAFGGDGDDPPIFDTKQCACHSWQGIINAAGLCKPSRSHHRSDVRAEKAATEVERRLRH